MKCQSCGKKEATVRYYENINGKQKEIFLCSDCAKKLGFDSFSDIFSPIFTSIPKFIDDFNDVEVCPNCGYTFDEYTKTGLFGCPECYNTFKDRLDSLFLKLNGKNRHVPLNLESNLEGQKVKSKKIYNKTGENKQDIEIKELKTQLQEFVKNEEYEKAAIVRDKIKKIENKNEKK